MWMPGYGRKAEPVPGTVLVAWCIASPNSTAILGTMIPEASLPISAYGSQKILENKKLQLPISIVPHPTLIVFHLCVSRRKLSSNLRSVDKLTVLFSKVTTSLWASACIPGSGGEKNHHEILFSRLFWELLRWIHCVNCSACHRCTLQSAMNIKGWFTRE